MLRDPANGCHPANSGNTATESPAGPSAPHFLRDPGLAAATLRPSLFSSNAEAQSQRRAQFLPAPRRNSSPGFARLPRNLCHRSGRLRRGRWKPIVSHPIRRQLGTRCPRSDEKTRVREPPEHGRVLISSRRRAFRGSASGVAGRYVDRWQRGVVAPAAPRPLLRDSPRARSPPCATSRPSYGRRRVLPRSPGEGSGRSDKPPV